MSFVLKLTLKAQKMSKINHLKNKVIYLCAKHYLKLSLKKEKKSVLEIARLFLVEVTVKRLLYCVFTADLFVETMEVVKS